MNITIDEIKKRLTAIKKMGYVKSLRKGPTGIGYTLETLLEIDENNISSPDFGEIEFTPSPSSIFQNKKIKYNNKKPTKNGIIWINFSKILKARCTLTLPYFAPFHYAKHRIY